MHNTHISHIFEIKKLKNKIKMICIYHFILRLDSSFLLLSGIFLDFDGGFILL